MSTPPARVTCANYQRIGGNCSLVKACGDRLKLFGVDGVVDKFASQTQTRPRDRSLDAETDEPVIKSGGNCVRGRCCPDLSTAAWRAFYRARAVLAMQTRRQGKCNGG